MIYKVAIPFVLFFVCAGGNKSKQRQYPALPQSQMPDLDQKE